jgi:phage-related protein
VVWVKISNEPARFHLTIVVKFDNMMLRARNTRPYRGDAYRTVYALQLGTDLWVLHAFQKKSKTGIKTPKEEIELVRARLKRLQEALGG